MFQIKVSKQTNRNKINCKNPFVRLTSFKSYAILMAVVTTVTILIILLSSITIEEASAQKEKEDSSNKDIKLVEYTNSKDGYKIVYPSDAERTGKDFEDLIPTFRDKNGEWEFTITAIRHTSIKNAESAIDGTIKNIKGQQGYQIDEEKKPLTVAGQPAFMFSYIIGFDEKEKRTNIKMVTNNIVYSIDARAPLNKFDQFTDLFFTMLKSFELTNILEKKIQDNSKNNNNNNNNKFLEYANSKVGYKIKYPSYAHVMKANNPGFYKSVTDIITPEWKFTIFVMEKMRFKNVDMAIDDFIRFEKSQGRYYQDGKKSLTIDGKPARMISGEMFNTKANIIILLDDNLLYQFIINSPANRYNQFTDLFFTMLKSFELKDKK